LILVGFILISGWIVFSAFRLARAGRSLLDQQQRAESLLETGVLDANVEELEAIVVTVREDIMVIDSVAGPVVAAGPLFGWLPGIGPLLSDGQNLMEMADAGSETAVHAFTALKPLLITYQDIGGMQSLPQLVAELAAAQVHLVKADEAATRLFAARQALERETEYPAPITALLARLDENSGLIHDGLKLAQAAPEILGYEGPRTYLLIAQNEDELRPTGGFISGAGLLTIDNGKIVGLSFDNANLIDDWQNKPYGEPPSPFREFMGMDIFLFRDANFWPDFAQSAAEAMALYSYGQDAHLDGAIAFDQHFLQRLLAATGPLPVPELARTVDANNVISQLREEWGPSGESENWILDRKAFMAPLAMAFLAQLNSGLLSSSGFELIDMLAKSAEERHLQMYSTNPATAELLDQTVWSGRLPLADSGDFVQVIDTNMGFNKVNAVVERALNYNIILDDISGSVAELELSYHNPPANNPVECLHGTSYAPDTQYDFLTVDCYWNYLRVYLPKGSQLLWSNEHPVPAANLMSGQAWNGKSREFESEDTRFTVFDNFLVIAPGQDVTVAMQYALPDTVIQSDGEWYNYQLTVRKQAGTSADKASISISIPDGANLADVWPQPVTTSNNTLFFDLIMDSDITIDLTYTR
jgi:hypothetical protein